MGTVSPPPLAMVSLLLLVFMITSVLAADLQQSPLGLATRDPRLFYISSSTATETLKTQTLCFKSGTTAITAACSKRKRREIQKAFDLNINPSKNVLEEVEFGDLEELHDTTHREGKFLQYWATFTTTTTTTSYTSTSTIATLECTPSNFGVSACS